MTEKQLYSLSNRLNEIERLGKELMNNHMYRYKRFVDNSSDKFECKYAKRTKEFCDNKEIGKVREILDNIEKEILIIRQELG